MITITLIITGIIILILNQFSIIKYPLVVFLVATIIIGVSAFIFKDKLNCPFAKKCPFTFCPLNEKK